MGQINTNNYPTVDNLGDADLLIVESSTNGTGTTTPKQLREHAIGTDPLQTTSQTVTGAINELKREIDEGGGSAVIGNPSDTASSILDKIKIGSRTYDASAIKPYTATNITTSAISISIGLAEDRMLNGRIIAVNTGSRSGTPSNAWGLNILYNNGGSSVGCAILKSDGTAFTDAVTANEVLFLSMDMTNLEATIVNIAGASGGGGDDLYAGLGVGKMTSYTNNIINTDIDLHRAPMAGDRLLIWFDATVQNPTGLTTYNNGTAVTSDLESVTPLYYNAGWNIVEYMNDGLLYNNVWVRKQNVPIPNNTLSGLSDTAIAANPTDGQVLTYNGTTGKWGNQTPSGVAESVVGTAENGTTASKAYAIGEHFIRNDKFCTVIAAIASGATLTQGTNYVEGTIADNITKRVKYSTSEHIIGTWIDGSTLYEKTIDCGNCLGSTGDASVSCNFGENITVVDIECVSISKNTDVQITVPFNWDNTYDIGISYSPYWATNNRDMLLFRVKSARSNYQTFATLRYVKGRLYT